MKITKISQLECGGFREPKGHLDTQMYPECPNWPSYQKKKKKKKKAFNLKEYREANRNTYNVDETSFEGPDSSLIDDVNMITLAVDSFKKANPKVFTTIEKMVQWYKKNILGEIGGVNGPQDQIKEF